MVLLNPNHNHKHQQSPQNINFPASDISVSVQAGAWAVGTQPVRPGFKWCISLCVLCVLDIANVIGEIFLRNMNEGLDALQFLV